MIELDDVTVTAKAATIIDHISLQLEPGRRTGLIGQSGSGKSTIARVLLGLIAPTRGEVRFNGKPLAALDRAGRRDFRRTLQPVFQDGSESLNPRRTVVASINEAAARAERRDGDELSPVDLLALVGLGPELLKRYPGQLSGGQRQRVSIARALAVRPSLLVLDEPTSALDSVSQQAVITTVNRLATESGVGLLLISHDLTVIERLCDDIHVLDGGEIVESGPRDQILYHPVHERTQTLRDAARVIAGA